MKRISTCCNRARRRVHYHVGGRPRQKVRVAGVRERTGNGECSSIITTTVGHVQAGTALVVHISFDGERRAGVRVEHIQCSAVLKGTERRVQSARVGWTNLKGAVVDHRASHFELAVRSIPRLVPSHDPRGPGSLISLGGQFSGNGVVPVVVLGVKIPTVLDLHGRHGRVPVQHRVIWYRTAFGYYDPVVLTRKTRRRPVVPAGSGRPAGFSPILAFAPVPGFEGPVNFAVSVGLALLTGFGRVLVLPVFSAFVAGKPRQTDHKVVVTIGRRGDIVFTICVKRTTGKFIRCPTRVQQLQVPAGRFGLRMGKRHLINVTGIVRRTPNNHSAVIRGIKNEPVQINKTSPLYLKGKPRTGIGHRRCGSGGY